jgi:heme-degrading monooxygenase HmoA
MTAQHQDPPFILINTFRPVDDKIDELLAFQLAEMNALSEEAKASGWLGNEVYRSEDGASLIVITRFRSVEAREEWARTKRARQHIEQLKPLVREIISIPVAFAAAHGAGDLSQKGASE